MTERHDSNANARAADFNAKVIEEFRVSGGHVGGMFAGSDLLLLHHTGAKSGIERVTPVAYQRVGDSYAIFASRGGGPVNPAWLRNLIAYPDTVVEVGIETRSVRARVAEPAERDVIYERQKERAPQFAEYERKAVPRKIPVIVLDPVK